MLPPLIYLPAFPQTPSAIVVFHLGAWPVQNNPPSSLVTLVSVATHAVLSATPLLLGQLSARHPWCPAWQTARVFQWHGFKTWRHIQDILTNQPDTRHGSNLIRTLLHLKWTWCLLSTDDIDGSDIRNSVRAQGEASVMQCNEVCNTWGFWEVFLVYTILANEGNTFLMNIRNHSPNNAVSHPTRLEPSITILQKPHDSHVHQSVLFLVRTNGNISHLPGATDPLQCTANSVDPLQCTANPVDPSSKLSQLNSLRTIRGDI